MDERTCIWIRESDSSRKWLFPSCEEGLDSVNPQTVIFDWRHCPYCGGRIRLRDDDPYLQPANAHSAGASGES